jgi:hypothetical protein
MSCDGKATELWKRRRRIIHIRRTKGFCKKVCKNLIIRRKNIRRTIDFWN